MHGLLWDDETILCLDYDSTTGNALLIPIEIYTSFYCSKVQGACTKLELNIFHYKMKIKHFFLYTLLLFSDFNLTVPFLKCLNRTQHVIFNSAISQFHVIKNTEAATLNGDLTTLTHS